MVLKHTILKIRKSPLLVVAVCFVAMCLHTMIDSTLVPLLPVMLHKFTMGATNNRSIFDSLSEAEFQNATVNETRDAEISTQLGIVIAARPAAEVICNILTGFIVDRFGNRWPMLIGMVFNAGAVIGFAFVPSFIWLIALRVVEAIGSSLSVVSCLALVSRTFPDDGKRTKALSTAYIGYSVGLILGYPLGPVAFALSSLSTPFLLLAVITLVDGAMRLVIIQPEAADASLEKIKFTYYFTLIKDMYFMGAIMCSFCLYIGGGIFMATGPNWMIGTLNAEMWQMGVIMCISLFFMLIGEVIVGLCGKKYRWQFTLVGMLLCVLGMALYPECHMIWVVIAPECLFRLGAGIVICCVGPALTYITDIRHKPGIYGPTFGLLNAFNDLGFVVGPIIGGYLVDIISFAWLYRGEAVVILIVSTLSLTLRKIPARVKLPIVINNDIVAVKIDEEHVLEPILEDETPQAETKQTENERLTMNTETMATVRI